ncbi:hypothetical protein Tco_1166542 [Tanacetum coccineum]
MLFGISCCDGPNTVLWGNEILSWPYGSIRFDLCCFGGCVSLVSNDIEVLSRVTSGCEGFVVLFGVCLSAVEFEGWFIKWLLLSGSNGYFEWPAGVVRLVMVRWMRLRRSWDALSKVFRLVIEYSILYRASGLCEDVRSVCYRFAKIMALELLLSQYIGFYCIDGHTLFYLLMTSKQGYHPRNCRLPVKIDDPNITMEEYIRLEEEKALKRGKVFNWKLLSMISSKKTLSCEPTVSSLNNEIDFRVSFDDSDDEDYTSICLRSHHPSLRSVVFDDLDFFKDFENEFPTIVYNNAQTSKSDLLTEPILNPQHIDEFNLKDETSLSECDEEEQNVLNFNDLFPFNVIYPNDSKSDKDNDDDKVDIEHSSGDLSVKPLPDVINTDVGAYAHGSNKLLETSINTTYPGVWIRRIDFLYSIALVFSIFYTRPRERNIDEYWWRIYKSGDLKVLES